MIGDGALKLVTGEGDARWRERIGGSGWPTRLNKGMMSGWIDPFGVHLSRRKTFQFHLQRQRGSEAAIIIPPGQGPPKRDRNNTARRHVEAIGNHGRVSRQRSSNDNRPSLVEIMMYRYKAIIGWRLRARLPHQRTEAKIGCSVVNRNWACRSPSGSADTRSHRNNRRCVHQGVFEGMLL